jgi:hypothetical protein
MEQLFISMAYRYVALALMLAEGNRAIEQLNVPGWQQVSAADVVKYHVSPPRLRAGGSVETSKYIGGFGSEGKLQFIQTVEPEPELPLEERHAKWSKMKSLVGTNEAYEVASNWLARLSVDVASLQTSYPVRVEQEYYLTGDPDSANRKAVMLPRFEVRWGTNDFRPAVWVSIFGPTKEPIHIRQEDGSFSQRPRGIVKDAERLLKIPDAEFARYDFIQKSNLVIESSPVPLQSVILPETNPKQREPTPRPFVPSERNVRTLEPATQPPTK